MQPPNERLQFGPYILDPAARQLLCNGVPVHLAPKSCDLLYLLLQNSGRVIGKEEILASIWPGVTVEEGNLTQHISLLRKLLGAPHFPASPCLDLARTPLQNWNGMLFHGKRDIARDFATLGVKPDLDFSGFMLDRVQIDRKSTRLKSSH